MKWVLIGLVAVLLMGGTGAAVFFLTQSDGAASSEAGDAEGAEEAEPDYKAKSDAKAIYLPISPVLTVNFSNPTGGGKYLQVLIQVMSRDRAVIEAVKDNMPAIRNDLIVLLGEQTPAALRTSEGKQQLQKDALQSIRRSLAREDRRLARGVEAVFFDRFVIQ